jgi:hypothetical protein
MILKFLFVSIIAFMISAFAAAWTAFMSVVWNTIIFPMAICCARMAKAWAQVFSDPSKYQVHAHEWLDVLHHPYFHSSLDLSIFERYTMVVFKHAGLFVVQFVHLYASSVDSPCLISQVLLCNPSNHPVCSPGSGNQISFHKRVHPTG